MVEPWSRARASRRVRTSEASCGARPAQHAERSKGIPAARFAGAAFHLEVHRARMRILERPTPMFVALLPHQLDRLGDALVGCDAGAPQVVQSPQDVVMPPRGERHLGPRRLLSGLLVERDGLTGCSRPEQMSLEQILLPANASGGDIGPRAVGRLESQ